MIEYHVRAFALSVLKHPCGEVCVRLLITASAPSRGHERIFGLPAVADTVAPAALAS